MREHITNVGVGGLIAIIVVVVAVVALFAHVAVDPWLGVLALAIAVLL